MSGDKLNKVSWKAGEFKAHGNSRKYLLHVLAEFLMQEGTDLVTIEPIIEEASWPPKEVAPIKSRFNE